MVTCAEEREIGAVSGRVGMYGFTLLTCFAEVTFIPLWHEANQPGLLTQTLEVVRMNSMLPAVLLLVLFVGGSRSFCVYTENFQPRSCYPGIVIRGSQLTGLAWLSSKHDVDFCRIGAD